MTIKKKTLIAGSLLCVVLLVVVIFKNGDGEPSFLGEDQNNNRVWDEFEEYISGVTSSKFHKRILMNKIIQLQESIENPEIGMQIKNFSQHEKEKYDRLFHCIASLNDEGKINFSNSDIRNRVINNYARIRAYAKFNAYLGGGVYELPLEIDSESLCRNL